MINSAFNTAKGEIELLLYIDDDDGTKNKDWSPAQVTIGPPDGLGEAWNVLAAKAKGDFLMMGNDDLIFQTDGWDNLLRERIKQYPDNIFVAWFDDGRKRKKANCTFPIISRAWYEHLGYFVPECFNFLYHDTWIMNIGKRLDRLVYIPEGSVKHMHYAFIKAEADETTRRHTKGTHPRFVKYPKGDKLIFHETSYIREELADKLRGIMDEGV